MHFTYVDPSCLDARNLRQGDLLRRTNELDSVLSRFHHYYAVNSQNKYFLVLTQSCDLVRRKGESCKSRYISIAPVRSLSLVVNRMITELDICGIDSDVPICTSRGRQQLHNFLERLINNNESNYFYLQAEPSLSFPEDCCAFLRIPVALRAEKHYAKCLEARLLSLEGSFQAKLGWLVGQLFSRVGTEDWEPRQLQKKIKDSIVDNVFWVDDKNLRDFQNQMDKWRDAHKGQRLDVRTIELIVKSIKPRKQKVIERIQSILESSFEDTLSVQEREKILQRIKNDPHVTTLLS